MSNVKSFKINNIDASINIATDSTDGLMSAQDHMKLVDISSGVNLNASTNEKTIYPNNIINVWESQEFIEVETDNNDNLLESTDINGNKTFYTNVTIDGKLNGITINSLNSSIADINDNISDISLDINDLSTVIGSISTLDTSIKSDLVSAINEINKQQIFIDNTLTQMNLAADAKTVGIKINELVLKIDATIKQLEYLGIGIDSNNGILKIMGHLYKLSEYNGDASITEYINATKFIESTDIIDNIEFQTVITDSEEKVLYGVYADETETDIDLTDMTIIDPDTNIEVCLNVVIDILKY